MKLPMRFLLCGLLITLSIAVVVGIGCRGGRQCRFPSLVFGQGLPDTTSLPFVVSAPTPAATPTAQPTAPRPNTIVGLAVLGASIQDEYQATDRGGAYRATSFNWVELLARLRNVEMGEWGSFPEPRRNGYAYNWARSGGTSEQMINAGQHTGAAQQATDGLVSHAIIQIGVNDFYHSGLGLEIYEGKVSPDELQPRLDQIADNIITAAETIQRTGRCQVLVASVQDYVMLPIVPELYVTFQDPAGRQRFSDAIAYLNQQLAQRTTQNGVGYFDFNPALLQAIDSRLDQQGMLVVGGELIDLRKRGDEPHFGLLDDGYIHPGTVLSGLSANVFIEAFNRVFQTGIAPLSDDEILQAAGIKT